MKRVFYLLLFALAFSFSSKANPGDTTWVQANIADLSWYGNYDTVTVFPHAGTTTYRKVYMYFTLGKYMCPAGSTYCGDWDYTVLNYIIPPGGQPVELSRLITPYANAAAPRTPWSWLQPYVYDVTDYISLLHDTATMRILYSGYSGGFTANIRFAFIEGTPERNVVGFTRLWTGSYTYGDTAGGGIHGINTHFPNLYNVAPAGTVSTNLKFTVTGHGSDANYCNEFCSHNYQVMLDNTSVSTETVWRSDCGINELSPQSGTWLYERANWCPGSAVNPHITPLPNVIAGTGFNIGVLFDYYVGNGGASYTTEGQLFYYGGINKTLDASLDQIIAPTVDPNHFRENPIAGNPIIQVRNTGKTPITSMSIVYGVTGTTPQTYNWTGTLNPLTDDTLTLPVLTDLWNLAGMTDTNTFFAHIATVNGVVDNDTTNNNMTSQFVPAPIFPNTFKITFSVGNEAISPTSTISEKSWQIYDINDSMVTSLQNVTISTTHTNTVTLNPGIYKFQITDSSCDGLNWWVWHSYASGVTTGYCVVKTMSGILINMNGYYTTSGSYSTYAGDFGCVYDQYFVVVTPLGVQNVSSGDMNMVAFPNPARNEVNLTISGITVNGTLQMLDALGRVVYSGDCTESDSKLDISDFATGVYTLIYTDKEHPENRLTTRLVITK